MDESMCDSDSSDSDSEAESDSCFEESEHTTLIIQEFPIDNSLPSIQIQSQFIYQKIGGFPHIGSGPQKHYVLILSKAEC